MNVLTTHDVADLAEHHRSDAETPDLCAECGERYPCAIRRLLGAYVGEMARRLYAEH